MATQQWYGTDGSGFALRDNDRLLVVSAETREDAIRRFAKHAAPRCGLIAVDATVVPEHMDAESLSTID